ncbi:MAG: YncE family protein, partial [Nitrospiraceae bacterium]|nr:YncE family protein [Nitrospiraceae bacterium]
MKKILLAAVALALMAGGYFVANTHVTAAQAAEKGKVPHLVGIAFISGEGGHIAMVNLANMKSPSNIEKDRIVITEAGSEMEGKIAGMTMSKVKTGGGIHGAAKIGDKLYVGMLDGGVVVYNLKTGQKSKKIQVGQKFCDAIVGPHGKHIYFEDMADGHVYEWDYKTMKTVDSIPVGAAVCGIQWVNNGTKAYVSDMPTGTIYVLDWKTKKVIKKITDPQMTFIHQIHLRPHSHQLWVAAPNEYDPGLKPATHKSQIVVIDTRTDKVIDHIVLPPHRYSHDVAFSPDGKWALIPARTYQKDSRLMIMNANTHKVVEDISVCQSCHSKYGIEVKLAEGHPNLCGITVAWGMKHKPVAQ